MGRSKTLSPSQRTLRARLAAHRSWENTKDPVGRTKPGRDAAFERFERQVDPDGVLSPAERRRRAEHARKAHMTKLAFLSSKKRGAKGGGDRAPAA